MCVSEITSVRDLPIALAIFPVREQRNLALGADARNALVHVQRLPIHSALLRTLLRMLLGRGRNMHNGCKDS